MTLKPDQEVEIEITDIGFGGEGVGRLEGQVIFVHFTLPGEIVRARIVEVKRAYARAVLLNILKASEERIAPPCQHFGSCGGCQYQHMAYSAQLRIKQRQIRELLARIGGFEDFPVAQTRPCPSPYGYRNRIMIRSQWNKPEQKLNIGFIRYDNRLVEDLEECLIAEPELNEQIKHVRENPPPHGGLKVVLRTLPDDWKVPDHSFFQNNFHLLNGLTEVARECLRASGASTLIDAYCGVGFFALELSPAVEKAYGIECDVAAINAARENAKTRNITNTTFFDGRTEEHLPKVLEQCDLSTTTILIDPPRKGASPETIKMLIDAEPAQIIYISCHPAMLARDLKKLCENGLYELKSVTPLDMFPQTQHVECIADLRKC